MWVSGTLLSSSLKDILAPLSLMWDRMDIDWKPISSYVGFATGLYSPSYDPHRATNAVDDQVTRGIFTERDARQTPRPPEGKGYL